MPRYQRSLHHLRPWHQSHPLCQCQRHLRPQHQNHPLSQCQRLLQRLHQRPLLHRLRLWAEWLEWADTLTAHGSMRPMPGRGSRVGICEGMDRSCARGSLKDGAYHRGVVAMGGLTSCIVCMHSQSTSDSHFKVFILGPGAPSR